MQLLGNCRQKYLYHLVIDMTPNWNLSITIGSLITRALLIMAGGY